MNVNRSQLTVSANDIDASYATNVSLRGISKNRDRFWQLFQNGLLHFRFVLPRQLDGIEFERRLGALLAFASDFYKAESLNCRSFILRLTIVHSRNMPLILPENSGKTPVCRIDEVKIEEKINLSAISSPGAAVEKLMAELRVRFNVPA